MPWNDFAGDVVDTPECWEVALRMYDPGLPGLETLPSQGTVDVTTRRTRQFRPSPGTQCSWRTHRLSDGTVIQSGQTTPSAPGLVTIPGLIVTKEGTRLVVWTSQPADEPDPAQPVTLTVSCPAPNPFSHETSIRFTVAGPGPVEVGVYTPGGAQVRMLWRGLVGFGSHAVTWDGRDGEGSLVPSGPYAIRVANPRGAHATSRVVRIR